jgi:hypothetical protein
MNLKISSFHGHPIFVDPLKDAKFVLNCGANHGEYSQWIRLNSSAEICSFEPDPRNYGNLPVVPQLNFYPIAIGEESGQLDPMLGKTAAALDLPKNDVVCKTISRRTRSSCSTFPSGDAVAINSFRGNLARKYRI